LLLLLPPLLLLLLLLRTPVEPGVPGNTVARACARGSSSVWLPQGAPVPAVAVDVADVID
jgi:hypothetical protein